MKINIEVEDKQLAVFLPHFRKKGLTWMVYNMRTRKGHDHLDFKELSDGLISPISNVPMCLFCLFLLFRFLT
jgi:hypothetical protein